MVEVFVAEPSRCNDTDIVISLRYEMQYIFFELNGGEPPANPRSEPTTYNRNTAAAVRETGQNRSSWRGGE